MNKIISLLVALVMGIPAMAQTDQTTDPNDTAFFTLKEVKVKARWANDTERYHYNQMKHYVEMVLPYVNAASSLFQEINGVVEDKNIRKKERKRFISTKEDEVREKFEDKVKDLNTTQGVLLVKLITRQTNMNIYKMLKEFKNPLTAMKWQTWARLNGMNLDKLYDPEAENYLELIMEDLGYPLPESYKRKS